MMRALISVLLSLMLVITSHSMAAARHADPAVGSMVICAGEDTFVVYVDAEGQPTAAPHLCPDCALHVLAALVPLPFIVRPMAVEVARGLPGAQPRPEGGAFATPQARAPPVLI